jgi:Prokaryotic E2 family E
MSLPATDVAYLTERSITYQVTVEANMTCVVLPGWTLPSGFNRCDSDLLVRLSAGYPDVAPDCWWFDPAVAPANGSSIPATEVVEQHLGRSWQRWSRHFAAGQWRSGVDGLESFLALISAELHKSVPEPAR